MGDISAGGLTTPARCFYRFAFLRPHALEAPEPRFHELRDGDAYAELCPILVERGYRYGGLLLNYPDLQDRRRVPRLRPSDLIVVTTRPPLTDSVLERRRIRRTGAPLERTILDVAGRYFEICSRSWIMLQPEVASHLGPHADRAHVEFRMYKGSCYLKHRDPYAPRRSDRRYREDVGSKRTAAFLVFTRVGLRGPMLLNAFGMDGNTTLVWCHLLRTRFAHLLTSPRFVMVELTTDPLPARPATLSFANGWRADILLDFPV